jgi:V-type H+-transporting ATPase subunit a
MECQFLNPPLKILKVEALSLIFQELLQKETVKDSKECFLEQPEVYLLFFFLNFILGNVLAIISDLEQPIEDYQGIQMEKSIYVVIYKEGEERYLHEKIVRICDSFSNERYEVPSNVGEKQEEIEKRINETIKLMKVTQKEIKDRLLKYIESTLESEASILENYRWFITKEKSLYHTLNQLKLENMLFKGLCWCPLNRESEIQEVMQNLQQSRNIIGPRLKRIDKHDLTPPTNFRSNDFLRPFQEFVNTYGLPAYQEINPALFTIVTFPFLFGIMFGDVVHGGILFAVAIYVCLFKNYLLRKKSMLAGMVEARYMLLFMGFFSTFCGFIYNEFASVPLILFKSCYYNDASLGEAGRECLRVSDCVYPFGVDSVWYMAKNELAFVNSFKMKMSVIVGVLQMELGVVLKGLNDCFFRKKHPYNLWFEFVPQILWLSSFFGFMLVMIYIKWSTNWSYVGQNAPSIITLLISIPLNGGDVGEVPLFGDGGPQKVINNVILSKK